MGVLPHVVGAVYQGEYRIHLVFTDGVEGTVDFRPWLEGPIFEPLLDLGYFRTFLVEAGTIAWPNGADIAPETLHEVAASHQAA
jgi:hypothetical protein